MDRQGIMSLTTKPICANDPTFTFEPRKGAKVKSCAWLEMKKATRPQLHCDKTYDGQTVKDSCPKSCGVCSDVAAVGSKKSTTNATIRTPAISPAPTAMPCVDDNDDISFTFLNDKGKERDCKWIAMNDNRIQRYCHKKKDGISIHDVCAESCNVCEQSYSDTVPVGKDEMDVSSVPGVEGVPTNEINYSFVQWIALSFCATLIIVGLFIKYSSNRRGRKIKALQKFLDENGSKAKEEGTDIENADLEPAHTSKTIHQSAFDILQDLQGTTPSATSSATSSISASYNLTASASTFSGFNFLNPISRESLDKIKEEAKSRQLLKEWSHEGLAMPQMSLSADSGDRYNSLSMSHSDDDRLSMSYSDDTGSVDARSGSIDLDNTRMSYLHHVTNCRAAALH